MNYSENEIYSFTYPIEHSGSLGVLEPKINYLYTDGSTTAGTRPTGLLSNYDTFLTWLNSAVRDARRNKKDLVAVAVTNGDGSTLDLFVPSAYDFVNVYNRSYAYGTTREVVGKNYSEENHIHAIRSVQDYYLVGCSNSDGDYIDFYEGFSYGEYETDLDGHANCTYDFTSVGEDTLFYTKDGYGFHSHVLEINTGTYLSIGVGNPYASIRDTAYEGGYSNGYLDGSYNGYENGYQDGLQANPDKNTADAFDYIGKSFEAVTNVLSIEVLPHVTLGLCFSIPLVLTLCMTIFKLIKK